MLFRLIRDGNDRSLEPVQLSSLQEAGWREKHLEDLLAEQLDLLVPEDRLMLIAQERALQEEADILAVDEHGKLYIFELKRGTSDAENLLQVIRYGQIFGQYSYDRLQDLFRKMIHDPDADLQDRHRRFFDLEEPLARNAFNSNQHFVVVTAGTDQDTLDAIEYWKERGLPITSNTFHVYQHAGEFLIEFHSKLPGTEDYYSVLSGNYVVNTNVTYDKRAYAEMLEEGKAAAYYDRKEAVDKIQRGDRVFLYHTGVGIIAVGRALDRYRVVDRDGNPGAEHHVPLEFLVPPADPVDSPTDAVSATEINTAMGTSHRFRQTVFSIDPEMADFIENAIKQKHSEATAT